MAVTAGENACAIQDGNAPGFPAWFNCLETAQVSDLSIEPVIFKAENFKSFARSIKPMHSVVSLHKYYLRATYMAACFEKEMPKINRTISWAAPEALHAFMFLSYWYATLYVIAEGWQELKLSDPAVDALLTEPHLVLLKRYRHGVFHFQSDYFDRRYQDFFDQGQAARIWVDDLHKAFTAFFTHWMDTHHLDGTLK